MVLELILLGAVQNLSLVMPVALLLGIVLALGRLYHDSEMTAAQACGAGSRIRAGAGAGLHRGARGAAGRAVAAGGARRRRPHARAAQRGAARRAVRAHQRRQVPHLRRRQHGGVRAGARTPTARCARVRASATAAATLEIALAQRATHAYSEGGDLQVITLYDGERYEGIPGERRFRIVRFAENTIPVRLPALSGGVDGAGGRAHRARCCARATASSAPSSTGASRCPIMALVWRCIAVPLARLRPRQGRYARVGYAVLIFFVYIKLAIAGKSGWSAASRPSG